VGRSLHAAAALFNGAAHVLQTHSQPQQSQAPSKLSGVQALTDSFSFRSADPTEQKQKTRVSRACWADSV